MHLFFAENIKLTKEKFNGFNFSVAFILFLCYIKGCTHI